MESKIYFYFSLCLNHDYFIKNTSKAKKCNNLASFNKLKKQLVLKERTKIKKQYEYTVGSDKNKFNSHTKYLQLIMGVHMR